MQSSSLAVGSSIWSPCGDGARPYSHLAYSTVQSALSLGHRRQLPHGELEDLLLLLLLLDLSANDRRLALAIDGLRLDLLQDLGTVSKPVITLHLPCAECRQRGWT